MRFALAASRAIFLLPAALTAWSAAALGQPATEHDVSIANHGRRPINELYVSPTATDTWGEDRLGTQTLEPGHSQKLTLHTRDCEFDVQAIYQDASREELHGINLCHTRGLSFDGATAIAPPAAVAATHDVTLANRAPRPIQQVLISPSDAGDWGDDRLGNRSISVGDTATVQYRGDCVGDIRVVFDNRSAEERRGVNLCAARRIAVQPGWVTADSIPTEAPPAAETVLLSVVNHTGHAATGLFLFPTGSADRGSDLLGAAALDDAAQTAIRFQRPADTCSYAARVVFGRKLPDQDVPGLDLCRSLEVLLP
jgi:hypothetical protein